MDQPQLKVGTIIIDNGKIGIITAVIENGVWQEMGLFSLFKNYEIKYFDGLVTMMTEKTMHNLISLGKIEVVAK